MKRIYMKKWLVLFLASASFGTLQAQDTTLKEYVGKYVFPAGSFVPSADVLLQDSVLSINSVQGSSDLAKRTKDTFALISYNGMAYFKRDSTGKVAGIKVEVEDLLVEGTKEVGSAWLPEKQPAVRPKKTLVK